MTMTTFGSSLPAKGARALVPAPKGSAVQLANKRTLARFQSEVENLACENEPVGQRYTLFVIVGAILLSLLLAALVKVDRVVTGSGELATVDPTVVVQSLNRAIIRSINVKPGDEVKAGQVLATLDPTFAAADVAQLEVQIENYDAEIARLTAEIGGKPLKAEDIPPRYAALQMSLYEQRKNQRAEQLRALDSKIEQAEATVAKLHADQERYAERAKIVGEVEEMRRTLARNQTGSKLNLLQAMDQKLEVLRNMDLAANGMTEAEQQVETARAEREASFEQWRTQDNLELVKNQTARDAALEQLVKARKTAELVDLRAPTDAVVQQMAKLSVGSVLQEAVPLFTLVPLDAPLQAEVAIDARDIGFIRDGDPVSLKVEAYNYLRHGTVDGHVKMISEDTFKQDQDSKTPVRPYYRALVTIDKVALANVPEGFKLNTGMPVTADVKVGERTLLSYLINGALRSLNEGMREP
jgi:HlyD family type I secretion membrane fusion protein